MTKVTLNVQGMSCNHCLKAVEGAVSEVGAQGKVDLALKQVEVTFDENKLKLDTIKEAIEEQGYNVV